MTLHPNELKTKVGVRELHDHLSRYVQQVQGGTEIIVTMRGRRVARLVPVDERDPLADLRDRGLCARASRGSQAQPPLTHREHRAGVRPRGEQRR